jgi:RNase P/RNase MRP subunit p29
MVNASNIVDVLGWFMKILKKMRLATDGFDGQLPVHTANVVVIWMAARQIKVIQHQPHSPDLALANFFLFPR